MLTIFAVPKPFTGAAAVAQENALASWRRLDDDVQIILFGDEDGIAPAAERHGVEHVAAIRRNSLGTPLLDDAFAAAQARARHRLLCYVNADIIFLPELALALRPIEQMSRFVLVGRRTDLDVAEVIDFDDPSWAPKIAARARAHGRLHEPTGMDFFIFPRGQLATMPPFPVGRALWDNWMIHHARSKGIPVIDATDMVTTIHQNHDYGHISGGERSAWVGAEVLQNWKLLGPDFLQLTIDDATWVLRADGAHPARDARHLLRRIVVWPALVPPLNRSVRVARFLYHVLVRADHRQ